MRIIVFFDLPVATAAERREYTRFRKRLIKGGFMMMQKSVYCKLALNPTVANAAVDSIRRSRPPNGVVQALLVTEKQYSQIEFIVGSYSGETVCSDERFIEL